MSNSAKPATDQAVLKFIAENDLAPNILDSSAFKELVKSIALSGVQYVLPDRRKLSLQESEVGSVSVLGSVLAEGLNNSRIQRVEILREIKYIGGTLCSDGAKNRKRAALNSTLMTLRGPFFVRSTDATGMHKITGVNS